MEDTKYVKTGTTTVGIVCKDGIVMAADNRATAGHMIVDNDIQKVQQITDNLVITFAGTASEALMLSRVLKSELKLKKIRNQMEVSVKEAANLMSRMVYSTIRRPSMIPGVAHIIMGGKDESGYYLYDIFPDGTLSPCPQYIASGSGSPFVFGVLENKYKKDITVAEGIELVQECITASMARDSASGNGIDVITITEEGTKQVADKKVNYGLIDDPAKQ